jgi:hypothetical protein
MISNLNIGITYFKMCIISTWQIGSTVLWCYIGPGSYRIFSLIVESEGSYEQSEVTRNLPEITDSLLTWPIQI